VPVVTQRPRSVSREAMLRQRTLGSELREDHRDAAADRSAVAKSERALRKSRSSPPGVGRHDVTCAPCRYTSAEAPSAERRTTRSSPLTEGEVAS
jgi:hypothetical protein